MFEEIAGHKIKIIFIFVLAWILLTGTNYFSYKKNVEQNNNEIKQICKDFAEQFRQKKVVPKVQELAKKAGPYVPIKNKEKLKSFIDEMSGFDNLRFATVLTDKDIIISHTDSNLLTQPFSEPEFKNEFFSEKTDDVGIRLGISPDNEILLSYSIDVIFFNKKVGKMYIVFHKEDNRIKDKFSSSFKSLMILLICSILTLPLFLFLPLITANFILKYRKKQNEKRVQNYSEVTQFGPYKLQGKIGNGGMAEVYLALREDMRKKFAVKKILPYLIDNKDFIKMFTREARMLMDLNHPNIVETKEFFEEKYAIIMECIEGKHLAEIMKSYQKINPDKGLPYHQVIYILLNICSGLDHAHSLSIIHRDISPQNIMISFQGEVKITDFGIAKALSDPSLTQTGVFKGKYGYISPEQAEGKPADYQSDIYSLGIIFYELLAGKRMYVFKTDIEAIRNIPIMPIHPIKQEIADISDKTGVMDELNRIVMKCLEKDRELRYKNAAELRDDLRDLRKNFSIAYGRENLEDFMRKYFPEKSIN